MGPDQPVPDHDPVGAANDARGTIAATHIPDLPGQSHKIEARLIEASPEVVVGKKTQLVCDRHPLWALAFALVAHTAVIRAVLFIANIQQLFVGRRVRSRHAPDIHLDLFDAPVMRNRCADRRIPENPPECCNRSLIDLLSQRFRSLKYKCGIAAYLHLSTEALET